jgi:hypothetical protein
MLALPGGSGLNPVWKIIWRMKVPSKVKNFTWRALHGIIPLKCNLSNHHIGDTGGCPICNPHLLFTYPAARELWTAFGVTEIIDDDVQVDHGSGVLEALLRCENNYLFGFINFGFKEVLIIGCWYLW